MRISQSDLALSASHTAFSYSSQSAAVRITANRPQPQPQPQPAAEAAVKTDVSKKADGDTLSALPPGLALLKLLIEKLTGQKIDIVGSDDLGKDAGADANQGPAPTAQQGSARTAQQGSARTAPAVDVEINAESIRYEAESSTFSARGTVTTADGRQITLDLQASISREYFQRDSLSIRTGPAASKDPLVLDLSGAQTGLSPQKINFDINADGVVEQVSMPNPGSVLLALDRNGNGTIDNGSELFGPRSGSGYGDLSALDSDHNGWIDEADSAFSQLRLWQPTGDGPQLETLEQEGVGAISLQNVATPFSFRDQATNDELGTLQSTGVFLREDGTAGTVRQIDVVA